MFTLCWLFIVLVNKKRCPPERRSGNGDFLGKEEGKCNKRSSDDRKSGDMEFSRRRRDGGVVERARLESVCTGNRTEGSNPSLSAMW